MITISLGSYFRDFLCLLVSLGFESPEGDEVDEGAPIKKQRARSAVAAGGSPAAKRCRRWNGATAAGPMRGENIGDILEDWDYFADIV